MCYLLTRRKSRSLPGQTMLDESLEHDRPATPTDCVRMTDKRHCAAWNTLVHVVELRRPDLLYLAWRRRPCEERLTVVGLVVDEVLHEHAQRDLDKVERRPPDRGAVRPDLVEPACPVDLEFTVEAAVVVRESFFQEELHQSAVEVTCRCAHASRLLTRDPFERFVSLADDCPHLIDRITVECLVEITVISDLVPFRGNSCRDFGKGIGCMSWNEPRALHAISLEDVEHARGADPAGKLAA